MWPFACSVPSRSTESSSARASGRSSPRSRSRHRTPPRPRPSPMRSGATSCPGTWPKQLQAIIGLIRRSIGTEAIQTTATGYALVMDADSLDVTRFASSSRPLARTPRPMIPNARPTPTGVRSSSGAARPTPSCREWEPAAGEISRLEAMRQASEEELLAARLACGEHRAAIAEAERLVRESPYREERWCLLALANYQSGRQAEALSALRFARRKLDEDLGIEPGDRLADLETAILRHDPALAPPGTSPASARRARTGASARTVPTTPRSSSGGMPRSTLSSGGSVASASSRSLALPDRASHRLLSRAWSPSSSVEGGRSRSCIRARSSTPRPAPSRFSD